MYEDRWKKACELLEVIEAQDGACHFLVDLVQHRQRISDRVESILGYSQQALVSMGADIWQRIALPEHEQNLKHWRSILPLNLDKGGVRGLRFVISFTALHRDTSMRRLHYESAYWYEQPSSTEDRPWAKWVVLRPDPSPVTDAFYGVVYRDSDTVVLPQWSYQKELETEQARLSEREKEILRYCSLGYASKETAAMLNIALNTVHNHRRAILEKLAAANMADAIRIGIAEGLVR